MPKPFGSIQERFSNMFMPVPWTGCWLWLGHLNNKGYGQFWIKSNENKVLAHRLSWEMVHGRIPSNQCVLHKCDVSCCVNPEHLFLGSIADNNADMIAKGRSNSGARQKAQTHCKHGHLFDEENTYLFYRKGRVERQCKKCKKNYARTCY